jgi:hypothetical protein
MAEKTIHPADAAQLALIPSAKGFVASLFIGTGRFAKREAETLKGARTEALRLAGVHGAPGGRTPMIYAVLADDRQVLVPDDYEAGDDDQQQPKEQTVTTTKDHVTAKPVRALTMEDLGVKAKSASKKPASSTKKAPKAKKPAKAAKTPAKSKKPAKVAKAAAKAAKPAAKGDKAKPAKLGKRAAIEAAAREGKLPTPPDFSAETHARFRGKLDEVIALAKAGDLKGLKAIEINPVSTSPKAIDRYRNLAVMALEAKR